MAIGNIKIENYVPAVRLNEGLYTEYDIETTGNLIVGGDITLTDDIVLDNAALTTLQVGTSERATVKGIYYSADVSVTVPSITDPDIAKVDVSVASAFTMQPAVGDAVFAIPTAALPTNCRLQGAYVSATDTVTITYGSEGGNVTGAGTNHKFLVIDMT